MRHQEQRELREQGKGGAHVRLKPEQCSSKRKTPGSNDPRRRDRDAGRQTREQAAGALTSKGNEPVTPARISRD